MINYLEDYFFGTKSKEFNEKEREFYREFTSSKKSYEKYLKRHIKAENVGLIFGRIIPNIVSLIGIAVSFKYENMAPFIMFTMPSEAWRNITMHYERNSIVERKVKMNDLEDKCKNSNCSDIDDYMKFLDEDSIGRNNINGIYFNENMNEYGNDDDIAY